MMTNDGLSSKLLFCQVAVSMKTQSTSLSREGVSLGGSRPLLRILGRTGASVSEVEARRDEDPCSEWLGCYLAELGPYPGEFWNVG